MTSYFQKWTHPKNDPLLQELHKKVEEIMHASLSEGVNDHNEFTFHKYLQEK